MPFVLGEIENKEQIQIDIETEDGIIEFTCHNPSTLKGKQKLRNFYVKNKNIVDFIDSIGGSTEAPKNLFSQSLEMQNVMEAMIDLTLDFIIDWEGVELSDGGNAACTMEAKKTMSIQAPEVINKLTKKLNGLNDFFFTFGEK